MPCAAVARPAADPAFAAIAQRRPVRLPGGAVDNTDATLIAAALREAQESGDPPEAVEVIGACRRWTDRFSTGDASGGINSPDLHYSRQPG